MSSETTEDDASATPDPVDVSISLHGIVCDVMENSVLREEFRTAGKSGPAWSQTVQSSHNTIKNLLDSADIPESVCNCGTQEGALSCWMCYRHGVTEVSL